MRASVSISDTLDFPGGNVDTPYSVRVYEEVTSTQDVARSQTDGTDPVVVVAHRQSQGRGRSGSEWDTASRAIAVSAAWQWDWAPEQRSLIPLVAGVAARRTLGESVGLKWPNDVLVGDSKVAGLLVELVDDVVVAGMGVNLFWPDPPANVTALHSVDPGPELGPALAVEWAGWLWELMESGEESWPRDEYLEACVTLGSEVTWDPNGRGRAVDIAADGSLMVIEPGGGTVTLTAGAVRHVRGTAT